MYSGKNIVQENRMFETYHSKGIVIVNTNTFLSYYFDDCNIHVTSRQNCIHTRSDHDLITI